MSEHWLVRRTTIRRLWVGFAIVLSLTVLAELPLDRHGHFALDGSFGFSAWYGLGACAAMVAFAKGLALLLKRPDSYYDGD